MSYGIKMAREPQMDTSAPEVEDYEEGDAIRALGFVQAIKSGRDTKWRYRGSVNYWPVSAYLSDRGNATRDCLFAACHEALQGNTIAATERLRRYIELCAEEFGKETE